jgi:maleate isomerase
MPRLGVIIPSSNTTVETEFASALQGSKITLHTTRIPLKDVTVSALSAMDKETETAAELLKDADVDTVAFACTSGSLIKGIGHDAAIAEKIGKIVDCPVVVTSRAVIQALNYVKAHCIGLATPYLEEVNKKEEEFVTSSGFEVANLKSYNLKHNLEIGRLTPNEVTVLAISANSNWADTIFLSCTNMGTFEVLPPLEKKLQKTVISSNSATLWACLNALKSQYKPKLGKLF